MSNTQPQLLKGFRDFLPKEAKLRAWLMASMRTTYERFGFEPLETPTLEYKSTIMGKYGEEADKLVYQFRDNGDREVAMRYDQTVPTARVIANYQQQLTFPFRRFQMQNVFRADKPQKGRYREFTQSDADIFGSTNPLADAEILAVFYAVFADRGVTSLTIKINDRQSLFALMQACQVSEQQRFPILQSLDKLDKNTEEEVRAELLSKGIAQHTVDAIFEQLACAKPSTQLEHIQSLAIKLGVPSSSLMFSPTLVRGLDYYTGMIFEGVIPEYGNSSIGGGGRYDHLIEHMSGVSVPAVGFGIGFDRTLEALQALQKTPTEQSDTYLVTIFDEQCLPASIDAVRTLRARGVRAELYPNSQDKLAKQMKYANKKQISAVLVLGPEEVAAGVVQLKQMATGEQRQVKIEEIGL